MVKIEKLNSAQIRFLLSLIEGKGEINAQQALARQAAINLRRMKPPFIVAKIEIDYSIVPYEYIDERMEEIESYLIRQLSRESVQAEVLAAYDSTVYVIVNDYQDDIDELFERIAGKLSGKFLQPVTIGIGSAVEALDRLNFSALDAQEALGYRYLFSSTSVINVRNVVKFRHRSRSGNNLIFDPVVDCFLDGNLGKMQVKLDEMVESIRYTPDVSRTSIRRAMVELTVVILNIASNARVNVDELLQGRDPYTWILSQNHTEIITEWFMQLASRLLEVMNRQDMEAESRAVTAGKDFIDENLASPELGLNNVSDHVGLTGAYFSQLFKQETGTGVSSYIMTRRIERAKELLKNTNLKIEDIALQCGFSSVNYFTQVFKKQESMTANQYRKANH